MKQRSAKVPVLILGGQENTLCLVRSFGKRGIPVYVVARPDCLAIKSRYCTACWAVPEGRSEEEFWNALLLKQAPAPLQGSLIFPASDEALGWVADERAALAQRYRLDEAEPGMQRAMLSKLETLTLARQAGCPTPAFHRVESLADLDSIDASLMFPIMIKPVHSHLFRRHYPLDKYLMANDWKELRLRVKEMLDRGLALIVTEMIPGPDDLQSAYFTYMTADGRELFRYTHNIIRRYPSNSGSACLTITRKMPETAEMGRRFFQGIGFRGMGHVEFKRDPRDGRLKIMECNARTSAAQAIVTKSGLDMPWLIYDYLVNGNFAPRDGYREGVRRWWFLLDLQAFLELRRRGKLSFPAWLHSVKGPPLVFPYFSLSDPVPFIHKAWRDLSYFVKKRIGFLWHPLKECHAPR